MLEKMKKKKQEETKHLISKWEKTGLLDGLNGEFQKGSIGPKIRAAMHFLKYHGEKVVITSTPRIKDALEGNAGTIITNEI